MKLYELAENCDYSYGEMQSEMIWYKLIVGIRDKALSSWMPTSLENAKKMISEKEAIG